MESTVFSTLEQWECFHGFLLGVTYLGHVSVSQPAAWQSLFLFCFYNPQQTKRHTVDFK